MFTDENVSANVLGLLDFLHTLTQINSKMCWQSHGVQEKPVFSGAFLEENYPGHTEIVYSL